MSKAPARVLAFALLCVLLLCFPFWVRGEEGRGTAIEPRADRMLRLASEYLKTASRFSFHVDASHEEVLDSGQKLQYEASTDVAARRPNGVWADSRGDRGHHRLWYDGSRLTILNADEGLYSSLKVPSTIDEAFDYAAEHYQITPPIVDLLYADPYAVLVAVVKSGFYVGLHRVRGVPCHHLAFSHEDIDWQVWIEDGLRPLPRKIVIHYKNRPGQPEYVAYLSAWDLSPQFPDSLFAYVLPRNAEMVELEALRERATPAKKQ